MKMKKVFESFVEFLNKPLNVNMDVSKAVPSNSTGHNAGPEPLVGDQEMSSLTNLRNVTHKPTIKKAKKRATQAVKTLVTSTKRSCDKMFVQNIGNSLANLFGNSPVVKRKAPEPPKITDPKRSPVSGQYQVAVTLEEVLTGAIKPVEVTRKVFYDEQPLNFRTETEHYNLVVPRGVVFGSVVTLCGVGDIQPNQSPMDVTVEFVAIPHSTFARDPNHVDLHTCVEVTFEQSVSYEMALFIPTLDGPTINRIVDHLITNDVTLTIPGYGLPLANDHTERGNLILHFEIQYPSMMTYQDKLKLASALVKK